MKPKVTGKVRRLIVTKDQLDKLLEYEVNTTTGGGAQSLCGRIAATARAQPDGSIITAVNGNDTDRVLTAASRQEAGNTGGWQALIKEILDQQPSTGSGQ